jgi:Zinc dependent phospholipase C
MRAVRVLVSLAVCLLPGPLAGYSVLTHEQVIDLAWKDQIQAMLLERYPGTGEDGLRKAHAYAYGGSLVQDMGYYPFGNKFFSDLLHYVRSGDFVVNLLGESSDVNEYAFALGALAHYSSDNMGHPTINQVVGMEFPKLRAKYGNEVTYADDPKAHIRTEFGFDMVQVAKNRYTSDRFHDFIGFEIAKPQLERAFLKTYGLKLGDVLGDEDLAIGTFRRAVGTFIPAMTRVALLNRRAELVKDTPNPSTRKFLYQISRSNYEKEWGKGYRRPGTGSRILAFLLHILPKVGPATALDFKVPNARTEDLYVKSVDRTIDNYHAWLTQAVRQDRNFPNTDCDTGRQAAAAEYSLADKTYARLLSDLKKDKFSQVTPELRTSILDFYAHTKPQLRSRKQQKTWKATERDLDDLRNWSGANAAPARALGGRS